MSNRGKSYIDFVKKNQEVTLPSGQVFLIRRPTSFWFATQTSSLPIMSPEELKAAAESTSPTPAEVKRNTELTKSMVKAHVLEPKITDNPNYESNEIGFDDLLPEDEKFIIAYLTGQVDASGSSITPFSREPNVAVSRPIGRDVEHSS